MIAVTGAAGKTGLAVIRALTGRGEAVRAIVRVEGQSEALDNIEVRAADLLNEPALETALGGAERLYHICPNMHPQELEIGRSAIRAARSAGVEHFVLHSVLHPQTQDMPHHWNKLLVEEALINSGLDYTVLQPASYMQNYMAEWGRVRLTHRVHFPYSLEAPFSPVDLEDVAEAAALVLSTDVHIGATYELCGPDVLNPNEMCRVMTHVVGSTVWPVQIDLDQWRRDSELDPEREEMLIRMFKYYSEHGLWGSPRALAGLLGCQPTSLAEFLRRLPPVGGFP